VNGVLRAAALSIHAIGQGLALSLELNPKHAVKQVDRLLSNAGVAPEDLFPEWVRFILADRGELVAAVDWTDFDKDDQTTLVISSMTTHGRATPLMWRTVKKSTLAGTRSQIESDLLRKLREALPIETRVTILADRAFGDQALYEQLTDWQMDYVIRFRGSILVTDVAGEMRTAGEWVGAGGRAKLLRGARVTNDKTVVGAVVCVQAKSMKEPWCLATSLATASASDLIQLYGRRFTIEENFRDTKDPRFGFGLSSTRIGDCGRRDRLLLMAAMAQALLTLLGAASEDSGYDRLLKVNTVKKRTRSLLRQGWYWYSALPNMSDARLLPLLEAFGERIREHHVFTRTLGPI
jgi:hypothetical protein